MIIALDFDGTMVSHDFPHIGKPREWMFAKALEWKKRGFKIILWTCRSDVLEGENHAFAEGTYLTDAVEFCKSKGLEFDAVNADLTEMDNPGMKFSRKIYADVYIDDKSVTFFDENETFQFNGSLCNGAFL